MLFNSLQYPLFLVIVFAIYWRVEDRFRWILLLIASYYFYMSWNAKYVVLILFTTTVSYAAALLIDQSSDVRFKKAVLSVSALLCLGVLFVFKYFNFFFETLNAVFARFAIPLHVSTLTLLLPVGISFYTFQTLSYVIDVYRGNCRAERHFGVYATFISFFPQLVAGPVERAGNLLPQIKSERKFDYNQATYGLKLMAWGYFKKLAIADVVAVYVDSAYSNLPACTGFDLAAAVFFFTFQIYCDFSGYSDIAIGTAKLLGIELMKNFDSPYLSCSVREFWRRWHISLSSWFRDYVYIPLGGNRCSKARNHANLLITFLVSGLWHGANWTFVFWGGLHGIAQILENVAKSTVGGAEKQGYCRKILSIIAVFAFCNIAWVFFRAPSFSDALYLFQSLARSFASLRSFTKTGIGIDKSKLFNVAICISLLTLYDVASLKTDVVRWVSEKPAILRWSVYLALIWLILIMMPSQGTSEFVYFQF